MKTKKLGLNKRLGNSDLFITPVGFGSCAVGGAGWQFGWGKQNDDESVAAIHRALESLQVDEDWLRENRAAIHDKIERAFSQFERCEGLTPEESLEQLEAKKVRRRAQQHRA